MLEEASTLPQHKSNLRALIAAAVILAGATAFAQIKPVQTRNVSGTLAASNTFQSLSAADNNRSACLVQNNSTSNKMQVYFGPIANATTGASVVLDPGKSVSCNNGPVVATDQVSIAGTSGDAFLAVFQ